MPRNPVALHDSRVREILQEEIFLRMLLDEGIWDDVVDGAKKLRAAATKKFGSVAGGWAKAVNDTLRKLERMPDEVTSLMGAIKVGMQKSGESLRLDDTLQQAKALGQMGTSGALELVQADLEGPVHDRAEKASASVKGEGTYRSGIYAIMLEADLEPPQLVNEISLTGALGVGMATLGGSIMLFKGLAKLAGWLGAEKAAHLFHKVEHVLHGFETKAVDVVVPDRLAYVVYSILYDRDLKIGGIGKGDERRKLTLAEFRSDDTGSHSMAVTKSLIYKVILIYFAWHGIEGAVKAGASLLGFVEGAATTIKGAEIAAGASELVAIARGARAVLDV
jgi:hypothetical protein